MLAGHLGFYNTSSSRTHVRFQFSTHAAAGGNVAPGSAFEAADLRIYKATDGAGFSATQRSSANGITMTSPFDSLTGFHDVDIDLTDNTDAGFYAAGSFYSVVLAPDETVDSQTLTGVVLAYFEIGVAKADVTQFGGTALTASGGRPEVNTSHVGGSAISQASGVLNVNATQISGDTTAADNAEAFFDGTGYAGTGNTIPTVTTVNGLAAGTITAASIAADAITAAKVAADVTTEIQSGLATAAALATTDGKIDTIDDFLDTEIAAILAAVDTETAAILALLDDARTEPSQGAPPVNPDLATKIDWLYAAWRNKKDNDGTTTNLYADNGTTIVSKQSTSESGGTVTKAEWITGA